MSSEVLVVVQAIAGGLLMGFIFSLVAAGLSLIWGVMRLVNFAHGDFLMLALYAAFWAFSLLHMDPLFFLPFDILLMCVVGMLVYRLIISRVIHAPTTAQTFATFGLSLLLRGGAQYLWLPNYRLIDRSLAEGRVFIGELCLGRPQLFAAAGAIISSIFLYWLIKGTKVGRALQAVSEDKEAASLMGIDSDMMYTLAWGIGVACVGAAGGLLAMYYYIFPDVGTLFGQMALVTVAMGGFGSIVGSFVAGLINGVILVAGGLVLGPAFKYIGVFVCYLAVVLLRAWRSPRTMGER